MSMRMTTICDGCGIEWPVNDSIPLRLLIERPGSHGSGGSVFFDFCVECKKKVLDSVPILANTYNGYMNK